MKPHAAVEAALILFIVALSAPSVFSVIVAAVAAGWLTAALILYFVRRVFPYAIDAIESDTHQPIGEHPWTSPTASTSS